MGTLDGRVVDADSGEALPGASVFVVDVSIRAVTDDDGAFAIDRHARRALQRPRDVRRLTGRSASTSTSSRSRRGGRPSCGCRPSRSPRPRSRSTRRRPRAGAGHDRHARARRRRDGLALRPWRPGLGAGHAARPVADGRRRRARSSSAGRTPTRCACSATASRSTRRGTPAGWSRSSSPRRSGASCCTAASFRPVHRRRARGRARDRDASAFAGDTVSAVAVSPVAAAGRR